MGIWIPELSSIINVTAFFVAQSSLFTIHIDDQEQKVSKNVHVIKLHSWICVKSKLRYPSGSRPEFGCQPAFKSCLKHCFSDFFMFFGWKISKIMQNQQRRWKMTKKVFRPAFGCLQYPKAGWNTQHLWQVDLRILVWSFVS